jgi:hypothetical protein
MKRRREVCPEERAERRATEMLIEEYPEEFAEILAYEEALEKRERPCRASHGGGSD